MYRTFLYYAPPLTWLGPQTQHCNGVPVYLYLRHKWGMQLIHRCDLYMSKYDNRLDKRPMGHKAQLSLVSDFKNYSISLPDLGKQLKITDTMHN